MFISQGDCREETQNGPQMGLLGSEASNENFFELLKMFK